MMLELVSSTSRSFSQSQWSILRVDGREGGRVGGREGIKEGGMVTYRLLMGGRQIHMWQSRVENEHYSVTYFNRFHAFTNFC